MRFASIAWHKKVAHTVHGFPALQESLRLLSDLMLPKHETIMNTETLLLLCGEGNMPLVPACFALPAIGNFLQGEDKKKRPISTKKVDIGLFYALCDEVNGSRLPFLEMGASVGRVEKQRFAPDFFRNMRKFLEICLKSQRTSAKIKAIR